MGLLIRFDRVDLLSIFLAPIYKCLFGDRFLTNHVKLQLDSFDLNQFDIKRFLRYYVQYLVCCIVLFVTSPAGTRHPYFFLAFSLLLVVSFLCLFRCTLCHCNVYSA